ncbi:iron-containing alcohol dehydrogenase [Parasalinivibrio latis]|uniref:iron-containing alcohol dehydrogenase n=1 Tax=Parasalinivibrio latis TaxID=2952610 RepID=UPI0030E19916
MLAGKWNYPTAITVGQGCLNELPSHCEALGMSKPLLVTDPGLASLPMVTGAVENCKKQGLGIAVFSDVQGNPTGENVEAGVLAYNAGNHDGVIAFGGGSSLDAAKAIALCAGQTRPVWDFEDIGDNWTRADPSAIAPVIAIPTTAGTGSEVGRASVITDASNHSKKIIFHPQMLPVQVLLDPEVTTGLPPHITAATGMDALSHNLEALCAPGYHPMADGIAMEGIRLIRDFLPVAYSDGGNIEARTQLLVASSMGATAFQKGLGGMHALAHTLGGLYDKHHGLLNAILMPYVMVSNRDEISAKMAALGQYLGLEAPDFDSVLNWVLDLRSSLGIPNTLAEIGISIGDAELVGKMAEVDPTAGTNPIHFSAAEYSQIFIRSVEGKLSQ